MFFLDCWQCMEMLSQEDLKLDNESIAVQAKQEQMQLQIQHFNQTAEQMEAETEKLTAHTEKLQYDLLSTNMQYNQLDAESFSILQSHKSELQNLTEDYEKVYNDFELKNAAMIDLQEKQMKETAEFSEMKLEMDEAIGRLQREKDTLLQEELDAKNEIKSLDIECDNLSYTITKLENKLSQVNQANKKAQSNKKTKVKSTVLVSKIAPKKRHHSDEASDSSFEGYSAADIFRQNLEKIRQLQVT